LKGSSIGQALLKQVPSVTAALPLPPIPRPFACYRWSRIPASSQAVRRAATGRRRSAARLARISHSNMQP